MQSILKQLQELADADLFALCEAVDLELQRREELEELAGDVPDSARRRANKREQGYRHHLGAAVPRVREIGIGKAPPRRHAA
jgi:hypothetical protein